MLDVTYIIIGVLLLKTVLQIYVKVYQSILIYPATENSIPILFSVLHNIFLLVRLSRLVRVHQIGYISDEFILHRRLW